MRHSSFSLALAAITLSCSNGGDPTEPLQSYTPSFAATVSRFPVPQLFGAIDFESNLSLLGGVLFDDVGAVRADPNFAPYDLSNVQDVAKPTGDNKALIKDEEQLVIIWAGVPPEGQFISCTFENQTPIAVGTVRSVYNDNDIFGGPGSGAQAFHYRATGTLTNPTTGQEYKVLIKFGGRTPPGEIVPLFDESVIQLTPVGGP